VPRPSQDAKAQGDSAHRPAQAGLPDRASGRADWDAFAERHLRELLSAFQQIEVTLRPEGGGAPVTVRVHMPYMMQSVSILEDEAAVARLRPRHQDRLRRVKEARDAAPRGIKAYLRQQFHASDGRERAVAKGRASPEDVRAFLQGAVDRGLVSLGEGRLYPDGNDLRGWLRRYGVGVDCSGFVQHALHSLVAVSCAAVDRTPGDQEDTGFIRAGWVYRQVSADPPVDGGRFTLVATLAEARPGDVLVSPVHIRIVVCVASGDGGGLVLSLAESTSARDVPCGLAEEEDDIGPRLVQVAYPAPGRPIAGQTPLRRCPGEGAFRQEAEERQHILGRYRALERARTAYQGRRAIGISAPGG